MRSSVAASISFNRERLLRTPIKPALHGFVRGIPVMVRGNDIMVGASGGVLGTGILANIWGEMDEIDAEMKRFNDEFQNQVPKDSFSIIQNVIFIKPEHVSNSKVRFFALIWTPFVLQWRSYHASQHKFLKTIGNIMSIWITTGVWDELQEYRKKLEAMVEKAKESDVVTIGPSPTPPRKNMIERGAEAIAEPISAIWKMVKIVFYFALGAVGIIIIAYAVKAIKG